MKKWLRFFMFICLTAIITASAGLLGSYLLYNEKVVEPIVVVVVDNDKSLEAEMFFTLFDKSKNYQNMIIFEKTDEITATSMLKSNHAAAVFTIPKDFSENIKTGKNEPFTAVYNTATPIKSQLIKLFADSFIELLSSSQFGVYTALDYAAEMTTPEQSQAIFWAINLKYLNIALARSLIVNTNTVSAITDNNIFQYYFFAAYVFIMVACSLLFIDILQNMNNKTNMRLYMLGVSAFKIVIFSVLSVFVALCFVTGVLISIIFTASAFWGLNITFNPIVFACLSLILLVVSALTVFIAAFFRNMLSAGVFTTLFSVLCLFLSGGVIPVDYFSELFKGISSFIINFWSVKLLLDGMRGLFNYNAALYLSVFFVILSGLNILFCSRQNKSKVG